MPKFQEPVVKKETSIHGDSIEHPAYGQIGAYRVSGKTYLYGSDFQHTGFVIIRIRGSQLKRSLSHDWHFAKDHLIEVALSEAQWASFVSGMNCGDGVPCTLQHIGGQQVPQIPRAELPKEKFKKDLSDTMKEIKESILNIGESIADGNIGKRKAAELQKRLEWIAARLEGSTGFVADQFDEHMETTVEKAKIEVNAYVTGQIHRSGLQALGISPETPTVRLLEADDAN